MSPSQYFSKKERDPLKAVTDRLPMRAEIVAFKSRSGWEKSSKPIPGLGAEAVQLEKHLASGDKLVFAQIPHEVHGPSYTVLFYSCGEQRACVSRLTGTGITEHFEMASKLAREAAPSLNQSFGKSVRRAANS